MASEAKHIVFDHLSLSELGNGFFGSNLVELGDFELTFITGDEGAGHDAHTHEDLHEILIVLDGDCAFTVNGSQVKVTGGSLLHVPPGTHHGVRYKAKSKVLRLKFVRSESPA